MKLSLTKNIGNFTTLARILFIFMSICLLNLNYFPLVCLGTVILVVAVIMDGMDGYLARKYNNSNKFGSLIDTLGDRITENLLVIFFAYKHFIPLWIPLIFVSRSFLSDFVRFVCFRSGIGTFEINSSKWGFRFVASIKSRVGYLLLKIFVFLLGSAILCIESSLSTSVFLNSVILLSLKEWLIYGSWILVAFNLIRFAFQLYDSRSLLRKELIN